MTDRYSQFVAEKFSGYLSVLDFDIDTRWDLLLEAIVGVLVRAWKDEVHEEPDVLRFDGSSDDKKHFSRTSARELYEAFEKNFSTAANVYVFIVGHGKDHGLSNMGCNYHRGLRFVHVSATGSDRVVVERFWRTLQIDLEKNKRLLRIAPSREVSHGKFEMDSYDDREPPPRRTSGISIATPKPPPGRIRKFFQESRTQLIVIGGAVVAAVIAGLILHVFGA